MTPIFLSIPVLSIPRSTGRDWQHTVDTRSVSVPIREWLRTAPRDITSCLSVVQNMRANPNSAWPYRVVALTLAVKAARRAVHAGVPDACEWPAADELKFPAPESAVMHFDVMGWNLLGIGPPSHGDGYVPKIRLILGPIWGLMDIQHTTAALCAKVWGPKEDR